MIETCRLKNVVIFIQTILSFVLSKKILQFEIGSGALNETGIILLSKLLHINAS